MEVFISVHNCDVNVIVGDFNVDFDRNVRLTDLLRVFVSDFDLSVCDLQFRDKIHYTYERDDGLGRCGLIIFYVLWLRSSVFPIYIA